MYELTFSSLVMQNASLIHNWNKNVGGIIIYCTDNPSNHLTLFKQSLLLREVEQYYVSTILSNHLEETDNVWEDLVLTDGLRLFWDLYVKDVEVTMEHIEMEDEEDNNGNKYIPNYPVDGLGSGLLSL